MENSKGGVPRIVQGLRTTALALREPRPVLGIAKEELDLKAGTVQAHDLWSTPFHIRAKGQEGALLSPLCIGESHSNLNCPLQRNVVERGTIKSNARSTSRSSCQCSASNSLHSTLPS